LDEEELEEFIYLNHPRYKAFMIYDRDLVVGYCFLTAHKKRQAYDRTAEVTIYLDPTRCGKGIGKTALVYLEEVARNVGISNLIGVITGENQSSIAAFRKAGYIQCAHFKNVGEKFGRVLDVVAFQKELWKSPA
jgi:L-amino acid N-acyltransferase YncA